MAPLFGTATSLFIILSNEWKSGLSRSFRSSASFFAVLDFDFGSVIRFAIEIF